MDYFGLPDTPSANSPVGMLMLRVLHKNPGMEFETARLEANRLLETASGKRVYRVPTVYSPEEMAERKARMIAAFGKSETAQEAA